MSNYTPRKSTRIQQTYQKSVKRNNSALLVPQKYTPPMSRQGDNSAKERNPNANRFTPLLLSDKAMEGMPSVESSPSKSPVKQKSKLDSDHGATPDTPEGSNDNDPLLTMSSSSNAASEQYIKESMLMLRRSFQQDIQKLIEPTIQQVSVLTSKVEHIENKMGEFATAQNNLADDHDTTKDEVTALRIKLADMEDRNRRNNLKFRGIPESVPPKELEPFLKDFVKSLLPDCSAQEMEIDRAHRLPRSRNIDPSVPRDVIARFHFFKTKENILQAMRHTKELPERFKHINIFIDLSQTTIQQRRLYQPITTALRENDIPYRWGFPVKLIIPDGNSTRIVHNPDQGLELLNKWGIAPAPIKNRLG
ncbi:uncharacterized protein LOC130273762 [Hyla sarda]|uniref:uncharacterized protein LOC130273762 n=1 Tax=Hyla sarda TaxID=327740 RepID=UPI0024C25DD3|nr:uncharacterized protein LOC130273762 [Hyla sarda]